MARGGVVCGRGLVVCLRGTAYFGNVESWHHLGMFRASLSADVCPMESIGCLQLF